MDVYKMIEALKCLEEHYEVDSSADIARLVRSNPILGAIFGYIVQSITAKLTEELNKQLPAPKSRLLRYPEVARLLGKSVGAVRKMKERGQIKVALVNMKQGGTFFSEAAVVAVLAEREHKMAGTSNSSEVFEGQE
jgi:hypothetical protein